MLFNNRFQMALLTLQKVASSANAADLLMKHVSQNVLQSLVPKLGFYSDHETTGLLNECSSQLERAR